MKSKYRTEPSDSTSLPTGIPYIIGNEVAERFSFYGMKAILVIFMTQHLRTATGQSDVMGHEEATAYYHLFVSTVYFFPLLGALISDVWLGKYRTIIFLSIVYCAGHFALAIRETRDGLAIGLVLIALGSGGIKPCVTAHVGDQFGSGNRHWLANIYGWFYVSINVGAFTSMIATPVLLNLYGPNVAFGVPGILMVIATIFFWAGRNRFVHVPAGGWGAIREAFSRDGLVALFNIGIIFTFVAVFFSLYDQSGSAWVLQATRMDRHLIFEWLPSQISAINPALILICVPLFDYVLYPALEPIFKMTALRRIGIGMVVIAVSFSIAALIESRITGGQVIKSPAADSASSLINLIDGESTVWVIDEEAEGGPEFVLRLRERSSWSIEQVVVNAPKETDLQTFEVLVGATKRVEAMESVGQLAQQPGGAWQVSFSARSAQYVAIRSEKSVDGLAIEEIQVIASEAAPPAGAHDDAAAVWPNVVATGKRPNIIWQLLAYIFLTAAEVMVSVTCLEFAYTQTPKKMKSIVMSMYLAAMAAGNGVTSLVNLFIQNEDGEVSLEGASYYWFFTKVVLVAAVVYVPVALLYRGRDYTIDEKEK
ncbi:MAG: MFS transporter [Pirellulaceae bacterium]|nr:MFS transporter [Pirellulaceae bacterium]MDP7015826.1 MFS transporter [Pirellulaceae bacterium]